MMARWIFIFAALLSLVNIKAQAIIRTNAPCSKIIADVASSRPRSSLAMYLADIRSYGRMTQSEEVSHFKLLQTLRAEGKKGAPAYETLRSDITHANLGLAISIAKSFQGSSISFEDLIQEANLGLVEAVDRFKLEEGARFASFAFPIIRRRIFALMSEMRSLITVPEKTQRKLRKLESALAREYRETGHTRHPSEIADELGWREGGRTNGSWTRPGARTRLEERLNAMNPVQSLSDKPFNRSEKQLSDFIRDTKIVSPENFIENADRIKAVNAVRQFLQIGRLDYTSLLIHHYGLDGRGARSLREIGLSLGLTRQALHLRLKKAIQSLKDHLRSEYPDLFPE